MLFFEYLNPFQYIYILCIAYSLLTYFGIFLITKQNEFLSNVLPATYSAIEDILLQEEENCESRHADGTEAQYPDPVSF